MRLCLVRAAGLTTGCHCGAGALTLRAGALSAGATTHAPHNTRSLAAVEVSLKHQPRWRVLRCETAANVATGRVAFLFDCIRALGGTSTSCVALHDDDKSDDHAAAQSACTSIG